MSKLNRLVFLLVVGFLLVFVVSTMMGCKQLDDVTNEVEKFFSPSIEEVCRDSGGRLEYDRNGEPVCY